jgi:hypothetical protein
MFSFSSTFTIGTVGKWNRHPGCELLVPLRGDATLFYGSEKVPVRVCSVSKNSYFRAGAGLFYEKLLLHRALFEFKAASNRYSGYFGRKRRAAYA